MQQQPLVVEEKHKSKEQQANIGVPDSKLKPVQQQTIFVFGAAGKQGESVCLALLNDKCFKVRAFFRRGRKIESAKMLEQLGAEIFYGDLNDRKSLLEGLRGCWAVYGVTNFWDDPKHPEREIQEGKNLCDACKEIGIAHFVFSSFDNSKELTDGKVQCPAADGKALLAKYARDIHLPLTEVKLGFYYENFSTWFKPKKRSLDAAYLIDIPLGYILQHSHI